jgi:hypothetical protein
MANDLTWQQLDTALGGGVITLAGNDIVISASGITGDTYAAATDSGVAEFMFKLRSACTDAQATLNESLPEGEEALNAFPGFSYGPLINGEVTVTQQQSVKMRLDTSTVFGTSI